VEKSWKSQKSHRKVIEKSWKSQRKVIGDSWKSRGKKGVKSIGQHVLDPVIILMYISSRVSSLGQSVEFRTIWALEISNRPGEPEPSEPKIRLVAGIHGNAPVGTELLLEFAALLCINYGKNPVITRVSFRKEI